MKFCETCGRALPEHASFCEHCGAPQPAWAAQPPVQQAAPAPDETSRLLTQMRKLLRAEHLAWKIAAIVNTCLLGLATFFVLLLLAVGFPFEEFFEALFDSLHGADVDISLSMGSLASTVPGIIVGYIMAAKTGRCWQRMHTDPQEAIDHCGSVGSIVLGALFNEVALIFIIINFVRCKCNKKQLEPLLRRGTTQYDQ